LAFFFVASTTATAVATTAAVAVAVLAIVVGPNGTIDRLKAQLVAKGYTQIFELDYGDTFSLVAKMASVHLFLAMDAFQQWPLYQLDIKNVFLNGNFQEIYME